jgi:hypothetical protein
MPVARCFTDEDIFAAAASALRKSGYDIVSAPEMGRLGCTDEEQLIWASGQGRASITFNVGHLRHYIVPGFCKSDNTQALSSRNNDRFAIF